MATKKIQLVLKISPEIMADIDIIYKRFHCFKYRDKNGEWRKGESKSNFLELMIRDFIETDPDCRAIRVINWLKSPGSADDIPKMASNSGNNDTIDQNI